MLFSPSPGTQDHRLRTWGVLSLSLADSGDLDFEFSSMKCLKTSPETLGNITFLIRKGHVRKVSTALSTFAPVLGYSVLEFYLQPSCHHDITIKKLAGPPAQSNSAVASCMVPMVLPS